MTNLEAWILIQQRLEFEFPTLLMAGVLPSHVRIKPLKNLDEIPFEAFTRCNEYIDYLTIRTNEYRRIRSLRSEETWAMYALQEIKGLREQIMLDNQAKLVRLAWQGRPSLLKGKYGTQKTSKKSRKTGDSNEGTGNSIP